MRRIPWIFILVVFTQGVEDPFEGQPKITVENGHLIFEASINNNITFRSTGAGKIRVNDNELDEILRTVQSSISQLNQFKTIDVNSLNNRLEELKQQVSVVANFNQQLIELDGKVRNITSQIAQLNGNDQQESQATGTLSISQLSRKVQRLENQYRTLNRLLNKNECTSNPCQNGGSCLDMYNAYSCQCPPNYQGTVCEQDVNECAVLTGTDLGCQNGGTCVNTPGGFTCRCPPNRYGVHCAESHDDCSTASHNELCGKGTCVNEARVQEGQVRYRCICEQGWTNSPGSPACNVDIDECISSTTGPPRCSQNPLVICINLPGMFHCGPCPAGYTGNGHSCYDINECELNNGGCSTSPRVECRNSIGSRTCGPCPTGYVGDGTTCTFIGICHQQNGGCSPLAVCIENSAIGAGYRECRCPSGFGGSGVGANGCIAQQGTSCDSNPCSHGACRPQGSNFVCICYTGYSGILCDQEINECLNNPCLNGGTCLDRPTGFLCDCTSEWQGPRCEEPKQECGGRLVNEIGNIRYPLISGQEYPHGIDCAWVISTTPGMVLSVSIHTISTEPSSECSLDFLQINDGPTSRSNVIGSYCGHEPPSKAIISNNNHIYLWFHSDHSVSGQGFSLEWNTTNPVCGGVLPVAEYGNINSPGYPGTYPSHRDCYWIVEVPLSKRIQFHFATLSLENHENCSFDYLKIYDGILEQGEPLKTYCTTVTPTPLITSGPYALLHFHSDATLVDRGFHITYSATPGVPGCGGTLTNDRGVFVSPNFPDQYQHKMECEWLIRVHPEERIELTFTEVDLEEHSTCQWDYVEIHDGENEVADLRSRLCGRTVPPPFYSNGNTLFIKFFADASVAGRGFRAQYITACGGTYSGTTGILRSPYYPNPYPSARTCNYLIVLPVGNVVHLNFIDFDVEDARDCRFDYVEVRDSGSANGTLLAHVCGDSPPEPITSLFNQILVQFTSDGSIENRGFIANYSAIEIGCGGVLTKDGGSFSTPVHPETYPDHALCNWIIRAPVGFIIQLTFATFVLESRSDCAYDYVEISDTDDYHLGKFCGTTPPPLITSTGNFLNVKFVADESVGREGFSANYLFLNSSRVCGGSYLAQEGTVMSPHYPRDYPTSRDCVWILNAPNGRQIMLNVTDFRLEEHEGCRYDFLEIRNGGTASSPLVGKYCGTRIPPTIISHSNRMWLHFHTDSSLSHPGFKMTYDATSNGCGGLLTSPTGSIWSPNYPHPYGHNAECTWKIIVAKGSTISVVLVDIDIEHGDDCQYDSIQLFDGESEMAEPSSVPLCSSRQNPGTILSTRNVMYIVFRTDISQSGRGFHLAYHTSCNVVLKGIQGLQGVIESPNYPDMYPHNYNCTWEIQAPVGNNISIAFSDVRLEGTNNNCQHDYIEILQKTLPQYRSPGPPKLENLTRICGDQEQLPAPIMVLSSQAIVRFVSDGSITHDGFRLEYAVKGCGGEIRKSSGTITSPNYPNGYIANQACEWLITTDPGTIISLTIYDFNLESSEDCQYDYLKVFGSFDETAAPLYTLCNTMKEYSTISSPSNEMRLKFHSDGAVIGRGFKLQFYQHHGGCGYMYYASTDHGTIMTPNYPKKYPNNTQCDWKVSVPGKHLVQLTIEDFDIPYSENCSEDALQVFDGLYNSPRTLLTHCGPNLPVLPVITSTSNEISLSIITTGQPKKGFRATYKSVCGARLIANANPNELESPNYPHGSHTFLNCTWIIEAPQPDEHVTFTFTNMFFIAHDNCSAFYVEVRDGTSRDSPLINTFCGTRIPAPITSAGRALHILMSRIGVFRATYSTSGSFCGGTINAIEGEFNSPNYPNSYPESIECDWIIQASPGNTIELTFGHFDIEKNDFCNTDYLEIRESNSVGKSLGRYCGVEGPTNITAVRRIWIRFHSDSQGSAPGFQAFFAVAHGSYLSGVEGQIGSPLFPQYNRLRPNVYVWTITVDPDKFIAIRFITLEVDKNWRDRNCMNYIQILDGLDDSPVLGQFCGRTLPDAISTHGNVATIKYVVQRYNPSRFLLEWMAHNETFSPTETPSIGNDCGGEIFMNRSSPYVQNNFTENLLSRRSIRSNCSWTLKSTPARHIEIVLNSTLRGYRDRCFDEEIKIYDSIGSNQGTWQLFKSLCGRFTNSVVGSSEATGVSLRKVNIRQYGYLGYPVEMQIHEECGSVMYGPSGSIQTLDAVRNNGSAPCKWVIKVRSGRTIRLTFIEFDVRSDGDVHCTDQYIELKNGGNEDSPPLGQGKYCGQNKPIIPESSSNLVQVTVRVSNDHYSEFSAFPGIQTPLFNLLYEELSLGCGERIYLSSQIPKVTLNSPNYPNEPPHDVECQWVINSPVGTRIRIDVFSFFANVSNCYSEQKQNVLEMYDGGTTNSRMLVRICEGLITPSQYTTGSLMLVRFISTQDTQHARFNATVSIDKCGGLIYPRGKISTPNFPQNYEPNLNCEWRIRTYGMHVITGTFRSINLPPNYIDCTLGDHIEVRENDANGPVIGLFCGQSDNLSFRSHAEEVHIVFNSGPSNSEFKGFELEIEPSYDMCYFRLETPTGTFSSPGYPEAFPYPKECVWNIGAPFGRRITLTFDSLNLPKDPVTNKCLHTLTVENALNKTIVQGVSICDPIPPIDSVSTRMTVHFHTNGLASFQGFLASYTTEKESFCGGTFTLPNGTFASPVVDDTVGDTISCKWQNAKDVDSHENETMVIRFKSLELESTVRNCQDSYLSIQSNGNSYPNYYNTQLCGNRTSENLVLMFPFANTDVTLYTSNSHLIKMNASYQVNSCGGYLSVPAFITSPGYPNNYPNNMDCAWKISTNYGEQIQISQVDLYLLNGSCENDYITIINGNLDNSPELGKYCNGSPLPLTLTSMENFIEIRFHSDGSGSAAGFNISAVSKERGCGGIRNYNHGRISSNDLSAEGSKYKPNFECQWIISMNPNYRVNITFEERFEIEMSTNCTKDYLLVEEKIMPISEDINQVAEWSVVERVCGHNTPPNIESQTNLVRVTFHTDDVNEGDGFTIIYKAACGGLISDKNGVIASPGYPDSYENNLECRYIINRQNNEYVQITFDLDEFEIEEGPDCRYDSVSIYLGNSTKYPKLGSYCSTDGSKPSEEPYFLKTPVLVIFKTDHSVMKKGFRLEYEITTCSENLTEPDGVITSPFYPNPHPKLLRCIKRIEVEENKVIALSFQEFNLEGSGISCRYDYVLVYDGDNSPAIYDPLTTTRIGRYCGKNLPPLIKSRGNKMTVVFNTDADIENIGFKALYRTTLGEAQGCGGLIKAVAGTINSLTPNSQGQYQDGLDCIWRIVTSPEKIIRIQFQRLDMEEDSNYKDNATLRCIYDYVEVRDGITEVAPFVDRYCGKSASNLPEAFSLSGNLAWIHFHSDFGGTPGNGFEITFSSIERTCGGSLQVTSEVQTLESPNFPSPYPPNMRCHWELSINNTLYDRVDITFKKIDIPCGGDYLDLFQYKPTGQYHDSSSIEAEAVKGHHSRLCGAHVYNEIFSTSQMALDFVSDSTQSGQGFSLTYQAANCSRTFTADNGLCYSTKTAYGLEECNITIMAGPGRTISLYFLGMRYHTRRSTLKVYDGYNQSAPKMDLVGDVFLGPMFSTGENLFFQLRKFGADSIVMVYTTTDQGSGCGGRFNFPNGTFTSPLYPRNYNLSKTCLFKIEMPTLHTIRLRFGIFALTSTIGCETNYVEIYQGSIETEAGKVGRFCGRDRPAVIDSTGNQLLVKLVTSENNVGRGFRAMFNMNAIDVTKAASIAMITEDPFIPSPTIQGVLDMD